MYESVEPTEGAEPAIRDRDRRQAAAPEPERGAGLEPRGGGIAEVRGLVGKDPCRLRRPGERRQPQQRRERDRAGGCSSGTQQ